ncbi:MAG: AzlD domain-containing protein [Micrococcales bacterium]|nr:AzlD domain-containing protein [Micrococcales bacterium]
MTWTSFSIIFAGCALSMLACRVLPVFLLRGRKLPPQAEKTIGFIPPAVFAALVATDLFNPGALASGELSAFLPLLAAIPVFLIAWLSRSLVWSAVVGVTAFAILWAVF